MGDVEGPSMGLNKMLHGGATAEDGGGMSTKINLNLVDVKPQLVINQNKSQPHQNLSFFVPLEHQTLNSPYPKRYNSGSTQSNFQIHKTPFLDSPPNPLQLPSSIKKTSAIDQLFKAAEMIQSGNNPLLAQSILARLNHQLSPIGKPFDRAAFYFKEALQLLIHLVVNNMNPIASPFSLIFKIGAYKSFSEVSPSVQFTNFTCNQALLEVLDGFDQVHIVDRG
ncbi:putative transcription factor GRAS family [Helianthus anomalus]